MEKISPELDLSQILELDEETKGILEKCGIKTVPQLLLENLYNKGLSREQQSILYSKCREKITSFPKDLSAGIFNLADLDRVYFDSGFRLGIQLMEEARENWTHGGNFDSKINLGSERLMSFFEGGFIPGETTELFSQDIAIIRRVTHCIIANTLFSSTMRAFSSESQSDIFPSYQAIYIQTTNNSFDPIFMKKCFQKLTGELESTQNSQICAEISHNIELLLSNVTVVTVTDYFQLQKLLYTLPSLKQKEMKGLKLIVIDPITSLLASHLFIEDQEPQNCNFKQIKDRIFLVGRLLRYTCKILNISSIVLSLAKLPPKKNSYILNYCSNQLLSNVNHPTAVKFKDLGTFSIPPPSNIISTEIDYNWLISPHNRILIENISNTEKHTQNTHPHLQEISHSLRLLRWTIFKSNRLPVGKYTCVLFDKVCFLDSNCIFI